ncbi:conserved hypothetical protein [Cronobacter muytjensii 530]
MNKEDRVGLAQLPAAVDDLLTAALHFRVIALYRGEIEIGVGLAGRHRGRRAAAEADIHCRAAKHNQLSPWRNVTFLHVVGADVADAAREHNRLVIAAQLFAVVARHFLFISTEIAVQRRAAKFVVERRAAKRAVGHNVERGDDAIRLAEILFPRLFKARDTQVRDGKTHQARFRLRAAPRRAFVADFAAGARRGTRPRRNGGGVVMRFHFHQDVRRLLMEGVAARLMVGVETPHRGAFHDRRIVFIGGEHEVRRLLERVFDHLKQRFRLFFAVDNPVGVENFVAAVFGVGLREHIELDVVRVAPQAGERVVQVVDFIFRQRQPQTYVGVGQRLTALSQQIHALHRRGLMMRKQLRRLFQRAEDALHHAVVQHRRYLLPGVIARRRVGVNVVRHAALQAFNLTEPAVVGDICRFRGPGRDGAGTRRDQQQASGRSMARKARPIFQQALKARVLFGIQRCGEVSKMNILGINGFHREVSVFETSQQFVNTKCRQSGRTTQNFHHQVSRLRSAGGHLSGRKGENGRHYRESGALTKPFA